MPNHVLTPDQLAKVDEKLKIYMADKQSWVDRYGADAEKVMRGRAINAVKRETEKMNKLKLKELVKKSLTNEADTNIMADFESKLKSHNWYYGNDDTDAQTVYKKGSAENAELKKIAKQLINADKSKEAADLYNKYNKLDKISFEDFIKSPQPFIPGYKRKQMGLDEEAEFSKEYDNNPALKGGQKKLPDALQKSIIKKAKGEMKEETHSVGPIIKSKEFKVGDKVKYKGMNHEITRIIDDRIYIKSLKYGGRPDTWVKAIDLQKSIIKKGAKNEILYNPGEIHGEYEIGDIVKYNGEDHEVTRVEVDRIYIRPVEPSSILGKKDSFWVEKNDLNEDIDLGHQDNEPHMIKGELYQIGKYAMKLYAILEELEETGQEIDFPAWWQSKITTAKNMMSGAKHYLDFELKEPAIDAVVDALTGEEYHEGEPELEEGIHDKDILSSPYTNIKTPPKEVGGYDPKKRAANLAALAKFGPKSKDKELKEKNFDINEVKIDPLEQLKKDIENDYSGIDFDLMGYDEEDGYDIRIFDAEEYFSKKTINKIIKFIQKYYKEYLSTAHGIEGVFLVDDENGYSVLMDDLEIIDAIPSDNLSEKKLTAAEKKKKEEIVKGMKDTFKGPKPAMYAIATEKAKKVAETLAKKLKSK